jgi:hypothetical protein
LTRGQRRTDVDIDDYIARLYRAFAAAPRPREDEITPHRCCECGEVTKRLGPHEAANVPDDDMQWLGDTLPLLGPAAFRYYLPRFIEHCLKSPPSMLDAVINYSLSPSGDLDVGERNRFARFSPAEARLMLEFVEHRASVPDLDFDRDYFDAAWLFWSALAGRDKDGKEEDR